MEDSLTLPKFPVQQEKELFMQQNERKFELDLLKSFIIIPMIGIHTMYDLSMLRSDDGVLEYVLNILSTPFNAPIFMFCMGITLGFSRRREPADYLKRGIKLLTIGMVLNVVRYFPTAYAKAMCGDTNIFSGWAQIFNVDIFQFAGLVLILFSLLRKLKMGHWEILATGLVLNVAGTLLNGCRADSFVVNQLLAFFYPTPTCCCFPLMNWFIFVAAGNVMCRMYLNHNDGKILRIAVPVGTAITAAYLYLCLVVKSPLTRVFQNDWEYYSMNTPDAIFIVLGIVPFMLGIFRLLSKIVPEKWVNVLSYPSKHIEQYYVSSWVLIMWAASLSQILAKVTTTRGFLIVNFVILLLSTLSVIIYDRYFRQSANVFFSRHAASCISVIWVALILFGAWYFSTIPGPYDLPY